MGKIKVEDYPDAFKECCYFLNASVKIKSFNRNEFYYKMKHIVEECSIKNTYIPEEIFIIAAIYCGFKFHPYYKTINISNHGLRK